MMGRPNVVVLLSGGVDSVTVFSEVLQSGQYDVFPLWVDYNHRAGHKERDLLHSICSESGAFPLKESSVRMPMWSEEMTEFHGLPHDYVPARNLILLSIASGYASILGAESIYTGFVGGAEMYPDTSRDFSESFSESIRIGTGSSIQIVSPYIDKDKSEVILRAVEIGVRLDKTWSCNYSGETPCGECAGCLSRQLGFDKAGVKDPLFP